MRIAIVEDDIPFAEAVERRINSFFQARAEAAVTWRGSSAALVSELERQANFDLYLFDVEMPDMDGLALSEKVHSLQTQAKVIFLTAHEKYALRGIQLGVYYYILKDSYWEELSRILERVCREEEENREEYYFILTETKGRRIFVNHILYLEKEKKYVLFHCLDGTVCKERSSLGNICEKLPQERFVPINRGIVVNMKHIVSLERLDIIMRDGKRLPISRYEKSNVMERLADYWGKSC